MAEATSASRGIMFKVIMLGEIGVGKTSVFYRLKDNNFDEYHSSTTGLDSCSKTMTMVDGRKVTLAIWDTAGVERFRTLTKNYYRNAHVCVFVVDRAEPASVANLGQWVRDASEFAMDSAVKVLIVNKIDLPPRVSDDLIEEFKSAYDCDLVFYTSAKTGDGIEDSFYKIATRLVNLCKAESERRRSSGFTLRGQKKSDRECSC